MRIARRQTLLADPMQHRCHGGVIPGRQILTIIRLFYNIDQRIPFVRIAKRQIRAAQRPTYQAQPHANA
jgi:hypothetical protein